jgi:hypothetical protein
MHMSVSSTATCPNPDLFGVNAMTPIGSTPSPMEICYCRPDIGSVLINSIGMVAAGIFLLSAFQITCKIVSASKIYSTRFNPDTQGAHFQDELINVIVHDKVIDSFTTNLPDKARVVLSSPWFDDLFKGPRLDDEIFAAVIKETVKNIRRVRNIVKMFNTEQQTTV